MPLSDSYLPEHYISNSFVLENLLFLYFCYSYMSRANS
jgi:hypothetical protein